MTAFTITRWDGVPTATPGAYAHVPLATYHKDWTSEPSISSSGLRTIFNQSMAHYWLGSPYNPKAEPFEETAPMILGRAAHHLVLGEAEFGKLFVGRPARIHDPKDGEVAWNSNRTVCNQWLEHVQGQGLTVLIGEQLAKIRGMAEALAAHPLIGAGILNGLIEHSFLFRDEETGVLMRSRPDALPLDSLDFADLKCVADVSDEAIERMIGDRGYHMQGAMCAMACRAILGKEMTSFSLVCVESAPPHCVRVKTIRPADLALGERQVHAAAKLFLRGLETGRWPGPGGEQTDAEYVGVTSWAEKKITERLELMERNLAA